MVHSAQPVLSKYLMGEFKRSLLRSSDSLQIKTKRCIVFGNVIHTTGAPISSIMGSSGLLR